MHSALSSWGIFGGVKDSQIREFVQIQRVSYVYELSLRGLLTFGHFGGGRGGGYHFGCRVVESERMPATATNY